MRSLIRLPLAALLALAFFAPMDARAFVRSEVPGTNVCFFWNKRTLPWTLNEKGAQSVGFEASQRALRLSFEEWTRPACTDLRFSEQAPTRDDRVGFNQDRGASNQNLLVFRPAVCDDVVEARDPCWSAGTCANTYNCWDFSLNTIAVTTTTYRPDTGEILDSDIEFNEAIFLFTTVDSPRCEQGKESVSCVATDIQNTATHEVGHLIGLDHTNTPESQQATMLARAALGDTFMRSLAQDDIDGVCHMYPAGEPTRVCVMQQGLDEDGGCGCASGGSGGLLWGGGIALWALFRRRRE